jgi:hypothetical protein
MQNSLPAGGLRLYREGVEPSGSLRKVSGYIPFSFPGLLLSQGWSTPSLRSRGQRRCWPTLSRYTHRVAISNRRLIGLDDSGVTFRFKDYRRDGAERYRTMTLSIDEFIRRFLLHVLPRGFHRIRHYSLLASGTRRDNLVRARDLLAAPTPPAAPDVTSEPPDHRPPCPCCGGRMIIIKTFERCSQPRAPPAPPRSAGRTAS